MNTVIVSVYSKPEDVKKDNIKIRQAILLCKKLPMIVLTRTSRSFWTLLADILQVVQTVRRTIARFM